MWPIMLKGSVLCMKLNEKKRRKSQYKSLYSAGGITEKQNKLGVGQKCTSPRSDMRIYPRKVQEATEKTTNTTQNGAGA
jgi:hypothetical protein